MAAKSKKPSDKVSRKICKYIELTQGCEAVGSLSLSSVLEPITILFDTFAWSQSPEPNENGQIFQHWTKSFFLAFLLCSAKNVICTWKNLYCKTVCVSNFWTFFGLSQSRLQIVDSKKSSSATVGYRNTDSTARPKLWSIFFSDNFPLFSLNPIYCYRSCSWCWSPSLTRSPRYRSSGRGTGGQRCLTISPPSQRAFLH